VTGINVRIGEIVVAELGLQMDRFPDEAHLARLCRSLSSRQEKSQTNGGASKRAKEIAGCVRPSLKRPTLLHASRDTFLGAYYQRLRKRMGHKKAIVALAHRILIIISHLLKDQQAYRELGAGYVDEKAAEVAKCRALRTLEQLGYDVTLQSPEVA
jgi:transposase